MEFGAQIAKRYDRINLVISLGMVNFWRRKFTRALLLALPTNSEGNLELLDVATGTGKSVKYLAKAYKGANITAIDLSNNMLNVAKSRAAKQSLIKDVKFSRGDALKMRYKSDKFDLVTSSFGVRNFADSIAGLREMTRVLAPGGVIAIMEFSNGRAFFKPFIMLYNRYILWRLAMLFGGAKSDYQYLAKSVMGWAKPKELEYVFNTLGLQKQKILRTITGVVAIHIYQKPMNSGLHKSLKYVQVFGGEQKGEA